MASDPEHPASADVDNAATYVRGGAGVSTDTRRIVQVATVATLVALAAVTLALLVGAIHQHSRDGGLQRSGQPVTVTVTSCFGIATGTGIQDLGYVCRGSFAVDGAVHTDVIVGNSKLLAQGSHLVGVVDPHHLSVLHSATAVAHPQSAAPIFARPIIAGAVLLLACLASYLGLRRRSAPRHAA